MKSWIKILIAALIALVAVGIGVYLIFFITKENDPEMLENVTIEKSASVSQSQSVAASETLTYTIKVTNNGDKKCKVGVSDILAAGVTLISTEGKTKGNNLTFSLSVRPGKTESVSYTVKINADLEAGASIYSPAAKAGEKQSNALEHFVGRALNASEKSRMKDAILALAFSENIAPIKLCKDIYLVAFSESPDLAETPEAVLDALFGVSANANAAAMQAMVAPHLFGGSAISSELDSLFK